MLCMFSNHKLSNNFATSYNWNIGRLGCDLRREKVAIKSLSQIIFAKAYEVWLVGHGDRGLVRAPVPFHATVYKLIDLHRANFLTYISGDINIGNLQA